VTTAGDDDQDSGADEPSGGVLSPSDELEAALRAATESVEAREGDRKGGSVSGAGSADKVLLEVLSGELQALKKQFEDLTQERDELRDRHLRLQAEFENFRRRGLKERQEAHNFGHQNLVKDLLPTVDNLDRAIAHATEGSAGGDLQALLQGIDLVRQGLLDVLGKHGVKRIEAMSRSFDPSSHEALAQVVDDSVPVGTVVQVLEDGYQLRDRMLRPSRVIVSKRSEASPDPSPRREAGEAEREEEL